MCARARVVIVRDSPPPTPLHTRVSQTVFPRAAAAGERQWSYDVVTTSDAAYVQERLQAFRCLMLERGIPCAPVTNANAREAPSGPGSCTTQ